MYGNAFEGERQLLERQLLDSCKMQTGSCRYFWRTASHGRTYTGWQTRNVAPKAVLICKTTVKSEIADACYSPVAVVHKLPDNLMGLHSTISIHLRHIHIVYEVDHCLIAGRAEILSGFFLEWLFQYLITEWWCHMDRKRDDTNIKTWNLIKWTMCSLQRGRYTLKKKGRWKKDDKERSKMRPAHKPFEVFRMLCKSWMVCSLQHNFQGAAVACGP